MSPVPPQSPAATRFPGLPLLYRACISFCFEVVFPCEICGKTQDIKL
jgi:hypothetical protein